MTLLGNIITFLQSEGVFSIYLPFLLTFSIFYALLMKSKIFGTDRPGPQISLLIAIIAGLFITISTPWGVALSHFFATFFAQATVFLTLIIVIAVTLGALAIPMLLGENPELLADKTAKYVVLGLVVLISLAMFLSSMSKMPGFPGISIPWLSLTSDDIALILLLVATGLIIYYAQKGAGSGDNAAAKAAKAAARADKKVVS